MPEPTPSFDDPRVPIAAGLEEAAHVLCCLDFDGTLAPIVDDPAAAAITPAHRRAVADLDSNPATTTAVVSGRALADVRDRVDLPITYAGNHGLEVSRPDAEDVFVHPIARKRASTIERVCDALEEELAPFSRCAVENKRLTGTVHVRAPTESARERIRRRARSVVDRLAGDTLETSPGKRIVEFSPSIPWGKGDAVALLAAECPPDTFVLYVGDDVTDESAFEEVEPEGVGVFVGDRKQSAASSRVESPAGVASLLEWLADAALDERIEPPAWSRAAVAVESD